MTNIPLPRLIGGIIATLRADVIPHVEDAYARGQAVGVIDLLNNLAPRIDWAGERLENAIGAKRALVEKVAQLVPGVVSESVFAKYLSDAGGLLAERSALDAAICDIMGHLWSGRGDPAKAEAIALIRAHLHDEATYEMKTTQKPLFAEIASGKSEKTAP